MNLGGAEKLLLDLLKWLDPARYRTVVFNSGRGQDLRSAYEGAFSRVVSCPQRVAFDVSLVPRLVRLVREEDAQVVISNLFYAQVVAGASASLFSAPLISWHHAAPSFDKRNDRWYHHQAFERVAGRFTRLICCSGHVRNDLLATYRLHPDRLVTVHNWVDIERFAPRDGARAVRPFTAGTVARFERSKGHQDLLRAFVRVRAVVPDARLMLVGDGPTRTQTESWAAALGAREATEFLGVRQDVEDLLPQLDAFVLPSTNEGFSTSILEAMSCGVPVVTYDIPSTREAITHGRTGFLCPTGDEQALADRLVELARNPELGAAIGRAARAEVEARFNRTRQAGEFMRVVHDVAGVA
jgi:glycosyltransferase involved in cell wall biosynthesis